MQNTVEPAGAPAATDPRTVWIAGEIELLKMTVKKTILCVDDEHSLSIQKVMLETRGYRVVSCHTSVEALKAFAEGGVDLVLSNVDLPDAPAAELARRIKALSPEVPVVLLSPPMRAFHTDAPVDLLLKKGTYAPAELLESIRLLMVKRRGPRRAVPAAADRRAQA
jgi:DNA-binding response OmpR family regulator